MGKVPKEDRKRNQALIADYKSNIKMSKLVAKYDISSTRIYQILKANKVELNNI